GRHASPAREEAPATTAATETPAESPAATETPAEPPAAPERIAAEGTPMERATSVAKARRSGKSPADIARDLGIDEDRVADLEKLENLPPTLQRELHNNYRTRDGETSTRPRSDSGMTEDRAITIARRIDDGSISPDAAEAMWKSYQKAEIGAARSIDFADALNDMVDGLRAIRDRMPEGTLIDVKDLGSSTFSDLLDKIAELRGLRDDLERKQRRAGDGTTTSRKARRSSQASVRKLEERIAALESEIEGIQSKLTDTFEKTKPSTRTAQQQQPQPQRQQQQPSVRDEWVYNLPEDVVDLLEEGVRDFTWIFRDDHDQALLVRVKETHPGSKTYGIEPYGFAAFKDQLTLGPWKDRQEALKVQKRINNE